MTFEELLDQATAMLQRRGRVTYRAFQRQFALDEDTLADLKAELFYAHPQVRDDAGQGLLWTGNPSPAPTAASSAVEPSQQAPLAYTPALSGGENPALSQSCLFVVLDPDLPQNLYCR
jgi:hypothetical protein